jgi:hypothetical protein
MYLELRGGITVWQYLSWGKAPTYAVERKLRGFYVTLKMRLERRTLPPFWNSTSASSFFMQVRCGMRKKRSSDTLLVTLLCILRTMNPDFRRYELCSGLWDIT